MRTRALTILHSVNDHSCARDQHPRGSLELFGSGVLDPGGWAYAGGGALTLRLALFRAPLALRYQASRTWLHETWTTTQVVTLGADL